MEEYHKGTGNTLLFGSRHVDRFEIPNDGRYTSIKLEKAGNQF